MIDKYKNGHFISVPTEFNQNFSHVEETNDEVYKTFDYMLVMYSTRKGGNPLVLPKLVDVEMQAFLHNMSEALGRAPEAKTDVSLEQMMRPSY